MSRPEIYPWSTLVEIGDYFFVDAAFKPYQYISMMVSQRNYRLEQNRKFFCMKTQYGCIVMLAEIKGEKPGYDFVTVEGVNGKYSGASSVPKPEVELTIEQKVARLTRDQKNAYLPWWIENGKLIFNPRIATEQDNELYYQRKLQYTPNTPYPDYYNLDENLHPRPQAQDDIDLEVEPWEHDEAPIIDDEDAS